MLFLFDALSQLWPRHFASRINSTCHAHTAQRLGKARHQRCVAAAYTHAPVGPRRPFLFCGGTTQARHGAGVGAGDASDALVMSLSNRIFALVRRYSGAVQLVIIECRVMELLSLEELIQAIKSRKRPLKELRM